MAKHRRPEKHKKRSKDVMNREVNYFRELEGLKDVNDLQRIENRPPLKEIYAQLEIKMETEAFRYENLLEQAQQEEDADSMGGTLVTPINGKVLSEAREANEAHERKVSWYSQPLKTLRDPETVRGSMVHLESPSKVRIRNLRGKLGVIQEDIVQPSPGIALLRDDEADPRPQGDDMDVLDMTGAIHEITGFKA